MWYLLHLSEMHRGDDTHLLHHLAQQSVMMSEEKERTVHPPPQRSNAIVFRVCPEHDGWWGPQEASCWGWCPSNGHQTKLLVLLLQHQ